VYPDRRDDGAKEEQGRDGREHRVGAADLAEDAGTRGRYDRRAADDRAEASERPSLRSSAGAIAGGGEHGRDEDAAGGTVE
jgi:hypothetical protein